MNKKVRKLLYFLVALICLFCLAGCRRVGSRPSKLYLDSYCPDIVDTGNTDYYYTIDKRTGVVYLSYHSDYCQAITVMLNADGTPVTADQLGIRFD